MAYRQNKKKSRWMQGGCATHIFSQRNIRDRGLYLTLPIPHCANSVLYVDYTEMPKFGGYKQVECSRHGVDQELANVQYLGLAS